MPGPVVYVPSRVGEGYFTDWQAPVSGDNGKVWAYNHGTGKFEPYTIPTVAPGGSSGYIQYNNAGAFGASGVYWDSANSRVGIGTASPGAKLDIVTTDTGTATINSFQNKLTSTPSGDKSTASYGANYEIVVAGTNQNANALGFMSKATITGTNTANSVRGLLGRLSTSGGGAASEGSALVGFLEHESSGTITNGYVIRTLDIVNTGTLTNTYGLYIGDVTAGTQTNQAYGLYQSDANARNHFAGNVGIGTTSPGQKLDVNGSVNVATALIVPDVRPAINSTNATGFSKADGTRIVTVDTTNGRVGIGTVSPNNKLDVAGTVQMDGLRINVAPTAETITCTHTITFSANGTNYKIPCVAA